MGLLEYSLKLTCIHFYYCTFLFYERSITNYVSGHLPTSQVLLKHKYQDHAECPRCDIIPETQAHILLYQAPATVAKWKGNMDNLRDLLKNEQTHPGLGKAIVKILNSSHDGEDINVSTLPGGHNVRHAAGIYWVGNLSYVDSGTGPSIKFSADICSLSGVRIRVSDG
jgi:hypothetical protein